MKILWIEDDQIQATTMSEALSNIFQDVTFTLIETVNELRTSLDSGLQSQFDLIILDGIVPWLQFSPDDQVSLKEPQLNNPYGGGRECLRLLLESEATKDTPVLVYSILEKDRFFGDVERLPDHVIHVRKTGDIEELLVHIRSIMMGKSGEKKPTLKNRFSDSVGAKPGWLGFTFDLKKFFSRRGNSS